MVEPIFQVFAHSNCSAGMCPASKSPSWMRDYMGLQTMKDALSEHIHKACVFVDFWVLIAMTEHRLRKSTQLAF